MRIALLLAVCLVAACRPVDRPSLPTCVESSTVAHIQFTGLITPVVPVGLATALTQAAENGAKVAVLEIDSSGGQVMAGRQMAAILKVSPIPVICVVDGHADSMALFVFETCQIRYMTHRSNLVAHEPYIRVDEGDGNRHALREMADVLDQTADELAENFVKHSRITKDEFYGRIRDRNWIIDSDEALRVGATDAVIPNVEELLLRLRVGTIKIPN